MDLSGMSNLLQGLFGWLVAILFLLLGIERTKNRKKDEIIDRQAQQLEKDAKQVEIFKVAHDMNEEAIAALDKIEYEQKIEEQRIEKAKDDVEETISIANDIVSRFNARH